MKKITFGIVLLSSLFVGTVVVYGQGQPATARGTRPDPAQYQLVEVAKGFKKPLYVTQAGDGSGRLFVLEQAGRIWIVKDGSVQPEPFLDISSSVNSEANERGLLGLAFHPQYKDNGIFFVHYSDLNGDTAIARYQVSADNPDKADPTSGKIILGVKQPYANHNGGQMAFGPDGYLYVGLGDGGSEGDPHQNGQNKNVLLGKLLRIDIDADTYKIPPDNPFADGKSGRPEVWAFGLRNPWRFSFDRATGDLYIGDVGQNRWEEVDFQTAGASGGANYGWNIVEGNHAYSGAQAPQDLIPPIAEYNHSDGCAIIGGYVYRGKMLPDLQGIYVYGDYCSGKTWAAYRDTAGNWQSADFINTGRLITSFGEDEAGELYLVDQAGSILRFAAAG